MVLTTPGDIVEQRLIPVTIFRFCPNCGAPLPVPTVPPERVVSLACPACGVTHYQNAKPCAGGIIVREGRVLLGRRRIEPFRGWWDIPGGFLEPWEHPRDAVIREVEEETGLRVHPADLLGIWIDRYGDGGDYCLNIYYLCEVLDGETSPGDDLIELRWFTPQELPGQIAFSHARDVLLTWARGVTHNPG